MAALAVVRDLREYWDPVSAEELERFETDVLAGFVLTRASAGLTDGTILGDVGHPEQVRTWFGRPLWDHGADRRGAYFGRVLRGSPSGTRLARSQALSTYFLFLELRHNVEIHRMTGRVVECPIDEMNRPRGSKDAQLRIPPTAPEVGRLFTGWGGELATCRKFAPTARNYAAAKLMSQVGLRVSEACGLDLDDIKCRRPQYAELLVPSRQLRECRAEIPVSSRKLKVLQREPAGPMSPAGAAVPKRDSCHQPPWRILTRWAVRCRTRRQGFAVADGAELVGRARAGSAGSESRTPGSRCRRPSSPAPRGRRPR
ncbi:hypothetical protein ACFXOD_33135 [Streptomyces sp. NPDC059161]|uniref:hypothetical protein n=1 Tax=Streptomyces sp. NPDC059161 TaxID=3346749 RepID=UPI00369271A2